MDRPMASRHPEYGFEYPVNCGYVPGTVSGDGCELDAYILGVDEPIESFRGACVAVIRRQDDDDDKLVVVPPEHGISDEEIRRQTHFQEKYFTSWIEREPGPSRSSA